MLYHLVFIEEVILEVIAFIIIIDFVNNYIYYAHVYLILIVIDN